MRERAHSCWWATDFLASGKHFLFQFSETLASDSLLSVYWKCLFQRNPSFRLVEMDLLANKKPFSFVQGFFLQVETVT